MILFFLLYMNVFVNNKGEKMKELIKRIKYYYCIAFFTITGNRYVTIGRSQYLVTGNVVTKIGNL